MPANMSAMPDAPLPSLTKLHLGCGLVTPPEWINVDKSMTPALTRNRVTKRVLTKLGVLSAEQAEAPWSSGIVRLDITKGLPWPDDVFDAVYSSHTFEHLSRAEIRDVLREVLRVLRPGGVLRLALPDLHEFAMTYLERFEDGDPHATDVFVESLYMAIEPEGGRLRRLAVRFAHRPHRWMYDALSIGALLEELGFRGVGERRYREGACPDLAAIETRRESLFVEGSKPQPRTAEARAVAEATADS